MYFISFFLKFLKKSNFNIDAYANSASLFRWKSLKVRGKARRIFLLGSRLRLKLGLTHKIFFFFFNLVWQYITKYRLLILVPNRRGFTKVFCLRWMLPSVYGNLGVNLNMFKKVFKAGKLSSYKKASLFNFFCKQKSKRGLWSITKRTTNPVSSRRMLQAFRIAKVNRVGNFISKSTFNRTYASTRVDFILYNFFYSFKKGFYYFIFKKKTFTFRDSAWALYRILLEIRILAIRSAQPGANGVIAEKQLPGGALLMFQTLSDYFFSTNQFTKINKNSRWTSMEEIISHFIFYAEGPVLPSGLGLGTVEAPKGHLGVSIVSAGGNKPLRSRIRSSIFVMAGQLNALVQGMTLGDFVVVVSGSNIVVGEIDR